MQQEALEEERLVRVVLDEHLARGAAGVERRAHGTRVGDDQRAVDVQRGRVGAGKRIAVDGLERGDALEQQLGPCVPVRSLLLVTEAPQLRCARPDRDTRLARARS